VVVLGILLLATPPIAVRFAPAAKTQARRLKLHDSR